MNDIIDKPNKDTDPIGWLNWFEKRRKRALIASNKTRPNRSEIAHKAWRTKRKASK